ncbi:MAG: Bax inhibitor-1/YccA family protein [Lachnoclostridium sp.]|nr:Bax inhibitor-1/YccA family protein [Lachnoclostridium sp.]
MNYSQTPSPYGGNGYDPQSHAFAMQVSGVLKQVFLKMFLGLIVSGLVAWYCANSAGYQSFLMNHSSIVWVFFLVEMGIVIGITSALTRMSATMAALLFYVFAAINGLTIAQIFWVYSLTSIAKTFFICAGTFGAMSAYGYFTTQDLTKWGSFLFYALLGLIIMSLVNIFTRSTTFEWIISGAGVLIFIGLTAWDTQQIKQMVLQAPEEWQGHISTYGALTLYLDFINLFLYLLRFFGNSRD